MRYDEPVGIALNNLALSNTRTGGNVQARAHPFRGFAAVGEMIRPLGVLVQS